jgi:hypothetical protein
VTAWRGTGDARPGWAWLTGAPGVWPARPGRSQAGRRARREADAWKRTGEGESFVTVIAVAAVANGLLIVLLHGSGIFAWAATGLSVISLAARLWPGRGRRPTRRSGRR